MGCEVAASYSQPCLRWNFGSGWPGSGKSVPLPTPSVSLGKRDKYRNLLLGRKTTAPVTTLLCPGASGARRAVSGEVASSLLAGKADRLPCLTNALKLIGVLRFQRQKPQESRSLCETPVCLLVSVSLWSNRFPHKQSCVWLISLPHRVPSHFPPTPTPVSTFVSHKFYYPPLLFASEILPHSPALPTSF